MYIGIGAIKFRSDGQIFVTANWDNTIRIYSNKSKKKPMKPLAVLRFNI
jgi:WD40 repeat protein